MDDLDYDNFRDPPRLGRLGLPGKVAEVVWHKGWCRGDYLRSWLAEKLGEFGVRTFADLPLDDDGADPALREDPDRAYRFVAMASDVTHGELVRLPWSYRERYGLEPDEVPVVDAVRASMAIPFFYRPARIPDQRFAGQTAWLVDGGILSNFPIDTFDRKDATAPRWPTLGIKLSSPATAAYRNNVRGIVSLSRAMLSTMAGFHDRLSLARFNPLANTIFVPADGISSTDFGIKKKTAEMLYQQGRTAAERFLAANQPQPVAV
jgi:NTE family protein